MHLLKQTLALALGLAGFSVAQAAIYTDIDLAGPAYAYLNGNGVKDGGETAKDAFTGSFNLVNHGYDKNTEKIHSAAFWFAFADDLRDGFGQDEIVKIKLEDTKIFQGDVDGSILFYDWVWGTLGGSLLATLSDTGILNYTVKILSGDTYLKEAGLIAVSRARQVPDGGSTVVLLGLGMLGLAFIRRLS